MGDYIDISLDGGVKKKIINEGDGLIPSYMNGVSIKYVAKHEDGLIWEVSKTPFDFLLGIGQVIKGWDIAVSTMKLGEKSEFIIRADYAFQDAGAGDNIIKPGETVVFEIELIIL